MLSNPETRSAYDHYGFDGLRGQQVPDFGQFGFNDLFNIFFGGGTFDSRAARRRRRHVGRGRRRRPGAARRGHRRRRHADALRGRLRRQEVDRGDERRHLRDLLRQRRAPGHRAGHLPAVPRQRPHARGVEPRRLRAVHPHEHLQPLPRAGHDRQRPVRDLPRHRPRARDAHRGGRAAGRHRRRADADRARRRRRRRAGRPPRRPARGRRASSPTSTSCATATTSSTASTSRWSRRPWARSPTCRPSTATSK